ncbi:MAG TPA: nitrate reductase associated protein [Puia sp.]|nr:nitrate reductase associated protein [Puia sp.]
MFRKFKFEEEIYSKLQGIPMSTRFKLDRVGIKLGGKTWNRFSAEEKQVLCHLSVRSQGEMECYREYLLYLLNRLKEKPELLDPETGKKERAQWENLSRIPETVYLKVLSLKGLITPVEWLRLDDLERYALFRLSVEKYSDALFGKALEEFLGLSTAKPA